MVLDLVVLPRVLVPAAVFRAHAHHVKEIAIIATVLTIPALRLAEGTLVRLLADDVLVACLLADGITEPPRADVTPVVLLTDLTLVTASIERVPAADAIPVIAIIAEAGLVNGIIELVLVGLPQRRSQSPFQSQFQL